MSIQTNRIVSIIALMLVIMSFTSQADVIRLSASLKPANQNGTDPVLVTDPLGVVPSEASGSIRIQVNTDTSTLAYQLVVSGIGREQLRAFGPNSTPIHLHLAAGGSPGNFGPIAVDLTLGAVDSDYTATDNGFRLSRQGVSILLEDQGNVKLGMHPGNENIVAALQSGNAFVLVHTNKDIFVNNTGPAPGFPFAEIRGNLDRVQVTERAPAKGMDTVVLNDAVDVSSAAADLVDKLEQQGFEIALIVDHAAAADSVNLNLAPNQVIFARPPYRLEKWLLRRSQTVGIDLPFKFHVFDDGGVVKLSVNTLGYLIDRHDLSIHDFVLRYTDQLISQFGKSRPELHGLKTIQSLQSREDTVQALLDAISANPDARIPLVLDYNAGKRFRRNHRRHRALERTLTVFGNPNVGTPLMQAEPRMGIDLPLKFLVWTDFKGDVNITWNDPHFLAKRVNLQGQDARLDAIAKALETLALKGAGQNP